MTSADRGTTGEGVDRPDHELLDILDRMLRASTSDELDESVFVELVAVAGDIGVEPALVHQLWRALMLCCSGDGVGDGDGDEGSLGSAGPVAIGERLARDGHSLTESLQVVMALRRLALAVFREEALLDLRSAAFIAGGMAHISRSATQFMVDLNRGHLAEELRSRARTRTDHDQFVWQSLTGTSPRGDAFTRIDAYGLDGTVRYHAFRARPVTDQDLVALESHLGLGGSTTQKRGMAMVIGGHICGFVTEPPAGPQPLLIALSEAVPFTELPSAFRRATRAFDVAEKVGLTGVQSLESLGVIASVVADREIAGVLTAKYLTPLRGLGEYGETLLETVRAYTANGCQIETTAQALDLHVNSARYRIAKFEVHLGVSLRDTAVLAEVWWALHLPLEWPGEPSAMPAGADGDVPPYAVSTRSASSAL